MAGETMVRNTATKPAPVIIDLGEKSKKSIKRLRRGEGKLMSQVQEALRELETAGKIGSNAQPVVIVVKEDLTALLDW